MKIDLVQLDFAGCTSLANKSHRILNLIIQICSYYYFLDHLSSHEYTVQKCNGHFQNYTVQSDDGVYNASRSVQGMVQWSMP